MPRNGYKFVKLAFKIFFFQSMFEAKLIIFFQNSETTFSKQFCPNFFFNVYCAKLKDENNLKKNY